MMLVRGWIFSSFVFRRWWNGSRRNARGYEGGWDILHGGYNILIEIRFLSITGDLGSTVNDCYCYWTVNRGASRVRIIILHVQKLHGIQLRKRCQFAKKNFAKLSKLGQEKKKKTNDNQISRGEVMAPIQGSRGARSSIPPPPGPFVIRLNEAGTVGSLPRRRNTEGSF